MTSQIAIGIDVTAIMADMGGPSQILKDLQRSGYGITRDTIMKWQSRQSLPMTRFIDLRNLHLRQTGEPLNLEKYLITKELTNESSRTGRNDPMSGGRV